MPEAREDVSKAESALRACANVREIVIVAWILVQVPREHQEVIADFEEGRVEPEASAPLSELEHHECPAGTAFPYPLDPERHLAVFDARDGSAEDDLSPVLRVGQRDWRAVACLGDQGAPGWNSGQE